MIFAIFLYLSSMGFLYADLAPSEWIEELAALKVKAGYYKANSKITGGRYLPESAILEHTVFDLLASVEGTNYRVSILHYNAEQVIPEDEKPLSKYIEEDNAQEVPKYFLFIQKKDATSQRVQRVVLCPLSLAGTLIAEKIDKLQAEKLSELPKEVVDESIQDIISKLDEKKLLEMGPRAPDKNKAISIYPHGPIYPLEH